MTTLTEWQTTVLQQEIARYHPDDVFNADETGLFWEMLPDKTYGFAGFVL